MLLTQLKISYLDLEKYGSPKFKDMTLLGTVASCRYHLDLWCHHCASVECYHFMNWLRTQLGLRPHLKVVNVDLTLHFLLIK